MTPDEIKNLFVNSLEDLDKVSPFTLAYDVRPSRCMFVKGDVSNCLIAKMGTGGNNVQVVISQVAPRARIEYQ